MNQEIKDKWISALESGQYKQGHCLLRYGNQHCALGVLHYGVLGLSDSGIGAYDPEVWGITRKEISSVWELNDRDRLPFSEIAIWIKEHL